MSYEKVIKKPKEVVTAGEWNDLSAAVEELCKAAFSKGEE